MQGGVTVEVAVFIVGLGAANLGALIGFVISTSVKVGKLETRVDIAERDLNNLGTMYRNQTPTNRRSA